MEQTPQSNAAPPVYTMRGGSKTREKGNNRFELKIGEFIIRKGEFVAVVGQSGCGKSTLLDILGLALRPDAATKEFTVHGHQPKKDCDVIKATEAKLADFRKSHIGYVLQTGGLLPFLTVRQNILLPLKINGVDTKDERADELADKLDIKDQLNKKPQFLSGGQRQRAAIARALAHHPPVVLADEPTAAVDKITAEKIMETFRKLTKDMGVTLLMVTHDTGLVENTADRVFTFEIKPKNKHHIISSCYEKTSETAEVGEETDA